VIVVAVAVAVVIAFAVISAGLDLIAMLVGVVLSVMFVPVAADVACFASAAADLVLIEVDAANLFSNPCSVSVAARSRKMINELVAQQLPWRSSRQ
jgi:hypothetical protein